MIHNIIHLNMMSVVENDLEHDEQETIKPQTKPQTKKHHILRKKHQNENKQIFLGAVVVLALGYAIGKTLHKNREINDINSTNFIPRSEILVQNQHQNPKNPITNANITNNSPLLPSSADIKPKMNSISNILSDSDTPKTEILPEKQEILPEKQEILPEEQEIGSHIKEEMEYQYNNNTDEDAEPETMVVSKQTTDKIYKKNNMPKYQPNNDEMHIQNITKLLLKPDDDMMVTIETQDCIARYFEIWKDAFFQHYNYEYLKIQDFLFKPSYSLQEIQEFLQIFMNENSKIRLHSVNKEFSINMKELFVIILKNMRSGKFLGFCDAEEMSLIFKYLKAYQISSI